MPISHGGHGVSAPRIDPELRPNEKLEHSMLYTLAVVLLILWLLGLVTSTTMGGFIHILLVIALVVVLVKVITGRSVL
jgi:hypothetical protein